MAKKLYKAFIIALLILLIHAGLGFSQTYEDYETRIKEIKEEIDKKPNAKNIDVLCYEAAKIRLNELTLLAGKNDIKSVRRYMRVSEGYYDEALTYLEKAWDKTKSAELKLDILFLKYLTYRERFEKDKSQILLNEIADRISSFSKNNTTNRRQLDRMVDKLADALSQNEAMKLKILYAQKVDADQGASIAEELKTKANTVFKEGDFKKADVMHKNYIELAQHIFGKDKMAVKIAELADNYFDKKRYHEALKYYREYSKAYPGYPLSDYCSYREAECLYFLKIHHKATQQFESFLENYPESKWFDDGFEGLCRVYYEDPLRKRSIERLKSLREEYGKRPVREYAELLMGIIYYGNKDYDTALDIFEKMQKENPKSPYWYTAETLINDIKDIKKGDAPAFSTASEDTYKAWDPYTSPSGKIGEGETITVKPGRKVELALTGVGDLDKFTEYAYDKSDVSRLPRKTRENETEEDLLSVKWVSGEGGNFLDEKQGLKKVWQAPDTPGRYSVSAEIKDLGLTRPPDEGLKKDQSTQAPTLVIIVEK